ncbi:MAG TPA: DUF5666 domain-containing protein [Albitalea sp.]|uniref:DUF5666 domain-containing protein n=1 Tax=Piscinibacter sp. TaxID=1903157 RepID=UPI002ED386B3
MSMIRWLAMALALVIVACGGGGGVDTGGTGGTVQSFSSGRIAGFGSIVVNGVHYDEQSAAIVDDEGATHGRDALALGMTVDVEAGPITVDAASGRSSSVASRVRFGSEIKGPLESVDSANSRLHVLGQIVNVDADTVFDGLPNGLASLQAGQLLEVFAFFDASTGTYNATRIERKGQLASYKLRGLISDLDTTAHTFSIGGAVIGYAGIAPGQLPGLQNGTLARVDLLTVKQAGIWVATRVLTGLPGPMEGVEAEVEGFVSDFASLASFKVRGVPVDASAAVFRRGDASQVVNGARVEVEGHIHAGVLVATEIEVKKRKGSGPGEDKQEFEFDGPIQSVDLAAGAITVLGVVVHFDSSTEFDHGSAKDLVAGVRVEVRGTLSNGMQLHATRIEFRS